MKSWCGSRRPSASTLPAARRRPSSACSCRRCSTWRVCSATSCAPTSGKAALCPSAPTHPHTHPLTHSLTHSLTHTLTHSLTHPHTHSLTHSPTHNCQSNISPLTYTVRTGVKQLLHLPFYSVSLSLSLSLFTHTHTHTHTRTHNDD